jgi:DNA-binding GntR family transcriptional regulator
MTAKLDVLSRPEPLGNRVYVTLRGYLRSGRIPRGQPLQEAVLAAQLGVSRTPVREALLRLANEGLVTADGRCLTGTVLSANDVEEIYTLRLLLEPAAVRLVAVGCSDRTLLAPLRTALDDMAAADAADDSVAFMDANNRFRTGWMDRVPNQRLARAIELYADHVVYLRVVTLHDAAVRAGVTGRLERVFSALMSADGDSAAIHMCEHLSEAKRILMAHVGAPANDDDL